MGWDEQEWRQLGHFEDAGFVYGLEELYKGST